MKTKLNFQIHKYNKNQRIKMKLISKINHKIMKLFYNKKYYLKIYFKKSKMINKKNYKYSLKIKTTQKI